MDYVISECVVFASILPALFCTSCYITEGQVSSHSLLSTNNYGQVPLYSQHARMQVETCMKTRQHADKLITQSYRCSFSSQPRKV